jgi:folylpolyglutamate synthase/dihydropteroate synthase
MIEEKFLESAIRIRKNYLKISSNLEFYHKKAKDIIQSLEDIAKKAQGLQDEINNDKKTGVITMTKDKAMDELIRILKELEDQSKIIETLADPMNKDIEKLSIEEQELYRQIKEKHSDISDEKLLQIIKQRIEKEGLS